MKTSSWVVDPGKVSFSFIATFEPHLPSFSPFLGSPYMSSKTHSYLLPNKKTISTMLQLERSKSGLRSLNSARSILGSSSSHLLKDWLCFTCVFFGMVSMSPPTSEHSKNAKKPKSINEMERLSAGLTCHHRGMCLLD
jgi:hypothetical protein